MLFVLLFSLAIAGLTILEFPIVVFLLRSPSFVLWILSRILANSSFIGDKFLSIKTKSSFIKADSSSCKSTSSFIRDNPLFLKTKSSFCKIKSLFHRIKISFCKLESSFIKFSKNLFLAMSGACLLALLSWQIYQRRYDDSLKTFFSQNKSAQESLLEPDLVPVNSGAFHLSMGEVQEMIGSGKYLYSSDGLDYQLFSSKEYKPWNQIWLVARNSFQTSWQQKLSQIWFDDVFYSGFNSEKRSKMKWYTNMLYETNSVVLEEWKIEGLAKIRYNLQQRLAKTYSNNQTAGLVLWMLIGDKSKFSKEDYQLFIDSGLVHLVAVSWWNVVMIVAFLTAVLFFVPFYLRVILILCSVIFYWFVCGMDSSVFRAILMGSLSLVALLVGRGTTLWRSLGLVYVGMLIYNPYFLVYDVGFLLSFSAVLGIVFMDVFKKDPNQIVVSKPEPVSRSWRYILSKSKVCTISKRWVFWIWNNYIKPSLGATLGIFPVIIFFMGQINLWWIIWNSFVLPFVPFIMIGWLIGWFLPWRLQTYFVPILDFFVKWNYIVAEKIDQYWPTIVADSVWIKFLLFFASISMIIISIWTLTRHEQDKPSMDKVKSLLDKNSTSSYDEILSKLDVWISKK